VAGRTQEALYREIDLALSWSEDALPQAERTKHVHALHPYLGKFVPQLAEAFLRRCFRAGDAVYDPFCGSGTTLVEAHVLGMDAVGCDVCAFNCLLSSVKAGAHAGPSLEHGLWEVLEQARRDGPVLPGPRDGWTRRWYAPRALGELLAYRAAMRRLCGPAQDVAQIVLSRAARSARLTTHFDLDFPQEPVTEPYWCHKHRRTCRPVGEAAKFLRRYTVDTARRLRVLAGIRTAAAVSVLHADSRTVELPREVSGVVTSPPYPGLIDYHEQHRYAYELLDLDDRRELEIGAATRGTGRRALAEYISATASVFLNARRFLPPAAPVVIVVNDSRNLYPEILERAELDVEERVTRHVNRRTGRRRGEYFEDVLVCRTT
jgi:hypothetical protein